MKAVAWVGPLILLMVWFVLSSLRLVSPLLLPGLGDLLKSFWVLLFTDGGLWSHIAVTVWRTILSFTISALLGVGMGLLMGFNAVIYKSLEFVVDFFRSIPPIALFPLFLLVFGIGEGARVGVPVYGATLVIAVNSVYGILNAPQIRRDVGKVCGLSPMEIFFKISLPDALPQVFVGLRTALSLTLVLTIVVEMTIGSRDGLGRKIYDYQLLFDTADMYVAIIMAGMLGYFANRIFVLAEQRIIHWADK